MVGQIIIMMNGLEYHFQFAFLIYAHMHGKCVLRILFGTNASISILQNRRKHFIEVLFQCLRCGTTKTHFVVLLTKVRDIELWLVIFDYRFTKIFGIFSLIFRIPTVTASPLVSFIFKLMRTKEERKTN